MKEIVLILLGLCFGMGLGAWLAFEWLGRKFFGAPKRKPKDYTNKFFGGKRSGQVTAKIPRTYNGKFAHGGVIKPADKGEYVQLSPGEYRVSPEAAKAYGKDTLDKINALPARPVTSVAGRKRCEWAGCTGDGLRRATWLLALRWRACGHHYRDGYACDECAMQHPEASEAGRATACATCGKISPLYVSVTWEIV